MEIKSQKIIADYLLKIGEYPLMPTRSEVREMTEHYFKFSQAIAPYLEGELRPDFLKESNEPWYPEPKDRPDIT